MALHFALSLGIYSGLKAASPTLRPSTAEDPELSIHDPCAEVWSRGVMVISEQSLSGPLQIKELALSAGHPVLAGFSL